MRYANTVSGNDECLNAEIISLGGARSRGTVEYEDYGDEDGQEEHLVLQCRSWERPWYVDEHVLMKTASLGLLEV
jgi:hypothetical protein